MPKSIRRVHDAQFKTKVVLKAFKGVKTLAQLSTEFGIHAQQITERSGVPVEASGTRWDANAVRVGSGQARAGYRAARADRSPSLSTDWSVESGRRAIENDWLKKKIRTS
ncbi:hypothetical protein CLV58_1313 [Spirosoma oryzae]|uniref:Transposase n=1 Tax=Spirosoma oryzae TaxID=1469603 RepID=A0A2T0S2Z1_9BACT|nr:hypothetical protein CLV58_1313 [Spirosoma oryzae]